MAPFGYCTGGTNGLVHSSQHRIVASTTTILKTSLARLLDHDLDPWRCRAGGDHEILALDNTSSLGAWKRGKSIAFKFFNHDKTRRFISGIGVLVANASRRTCRQS